MPAAELRPAAQRRAIGPASPQSGGSRQRLTAGPGLEPDDLADPQGASSIPGTLFEATAKVYSGPIYLQQPIELHGHELVDECRNLLAKAPLELCLAWFDRYREVVAGAQPQQSVVSHYRRHRPGESQLDPERPLAEQFNLLRVVENQRYPAFFRWQGRRYVLQLDAECLRSH